MKVKEQQNVQLNIKPKIIGLFTYEYYSQIHQ